ncbi:transposase family protein, partial [[Clostridium] innocuum]|nr:transposase family protein [[Clostridium] innocuum]MCR0626476.1 transposase family protein [[Clostridium] innocuum]
MADSVFSAPSLQLNDFLAAFGLDRADIKAIDISQDSGSLIIFLELNIKEHRCPICHSPTTKVKGYQLKKIIHSVLNPTPCLIHYRARRYVCPVCAKTFYENNPFISGNSKASV